MTVGRFAVAVLGLSVVVAIVAFVFREDDVAYILRLGKLDARWQDVARQSLAEIVETSKIGKNYAFNEPRGNRGVAFILFDSRLSAVRSRNVHSCGFYPASRNIICDVSFIDAFLAQRDLDKQIVPFEGNRPLDVMHELESLPPELYDANRSFMLQWVLGHELGHFLAGHGASHFAQTPLDERVEAKSLLQSREIEADAFLARHFDIKNESGFRFYTNLIYLLNVEIHQKACPSLSPLQYCKNINAGAGIFSPSVVVHFKTSGSHPEYLIRLVRLLKEAHELYDLGGIGYLNDRIVEHFEEKAM